MTIDINKLIVEKIRKALDRDLRVDSKHIIVRVMSGKVILSGKVPSITSIGVAANIVRKEVGAEVHNNLKSSFKPMFAFR
jgi:osmotically-inducible protein OsmY